MRCFVIRRLEYTVGIPMRKSVPFRDTVRDWVPRFGLQGMLGN